MSSDTNIDQISAGTAVQEPEILGMAEYMADREHGTNHFAPAAWNSLWWEPAKRQIFMAQADQRLALILDLAYSAGRAVAGYPEKPMEGAAQESGPF